MCYDKKTCIYFDRIVQKSVAVLGKKQHMERELLIVPEQMTLLSQGRSRSGDDKGRSLFKGNWRGGDHEKPG